MTLSTLTALSPLDGRYASKTAQLRPIVSEYALIFYRVMIEIEWLTILSETDNLTGLAALTVDEKQFLKQIVDQFDEAEAEKIKTIEQKTNHDVKAVEYYLQEKISTHNSLKRWVSWIHFGCTSEDINNLAYALMIKKSRDAILMPMLQALISTITQLAKDYAEIAMLSRTHGQPATPTTLGKEFKNFAMRLKKQVDCWGDLPIMGKCNGAVGNFNAHCVALPTIEWLTLSKKFVESLGLEWSAYTTQIEPHDFLAQWLNALSLCHTILIDFSRDIWGYIALHYFALKKSTQEVGSSTMPHKVNPIDFENAEGNLGLAIALATHFAQKLPISRWQRDLSDSTVMRNVGCIFGYSVIAYHSFQQGLEKLMPNVRVIQQELNAHWEVLAEPIQMVMRQEGIVDAYEQLKQFSRGEQLTQASVKNFIDALNISDAAKNKLKQLTPENYVGLAVVMAKKN